MMTQSRQDLTSPADDDVEGHEDPLAEMTELQNATPSKEIQPEEEVVKPAINSD